MHRIPVNRHQLGVDSRYDRQLKLVKRRFATKRNPQASKSVQDNASFRIGNDLNRALAFGSFAPRVYL
jgi:hypothetical protein